MGSDGALRRPSALNLKARTPQRGVPTMCPDPEKFAAAADRATMSGYETFSAARHVGGPHGGGDLV